MYIYCYICLNNKFWFVAIATKGEKQNFDIPVSDLPLFYHVPVIDLLPQLNGSLSFNILSFLTFADK